MCVCLYVCVVDVCVCVCVRVCVCVYMYVLCTHAFVLSHLHIWEINLKLLFEIHESFFLIKDKNLIERIEIFNFNIFITNGFN